MLPSKTAIVCGFIQMVPSFPAFVVPVFRSSNSTQRWVQQISDGKVRKFVPAPEFDFYVEATSNADSWIGSSPVHGFAYSENEAFFGNEMPMAMHLLDNRKRLSKKPHVLAEAADFYLQFFKGRRDGRKDSPPILGDLVHESSRRTREALMGVPKSMRRPFLIEVVVAEKSGPDSTNRVRKLAEGAVHMNFWTLSSMVEWVDGVASDNKIRWFKRVVEDRFSSAEHVVVMGTTDNPHEQRYLELVLDSASKEPSKFTRLADANGLEQWTRHMRNLSRHPSDESDKEYVARIFGLDNAFELGLRTKSRAKRLE
ncbi:hypothetical protein PQQ81_31895 [Paraburkholderia strydomiana]|uniref:hypothetical protein n=1 Tax=Paraburkholderia strydomiana TaxID=1245417 RepID=UPI0038B97024